MDVIKLNSDKTSMRRHREIERDREKVEGNK